MRSINQKIDTMFIQLNNRVDETNNKMEVMFMQLNSRIDEINKSLNEVNASLNKRIDETNKRMEAMSMHLNNRIDILSNRIDGLTREIIKLSGRMGKVEKEVKIALETKKIIEDAITRIGRIENIVYKAS